MKKQLFIALLIVVCFQPVHSQAQEEYPIPVSESVEKTEPGTMVFLSYPKYYRDAEEKLALVETDLVESTDSEWDYEVSKGIWQLKVKTDGTFQAQHEGDVFTYRFQNLGIGQGSEFRSVDLGEPDFSNFQIIGDTIRWNEVLPDIDLTVRYIHDILKVDVIVKQEFMNDLRAEVNSGGLSGEDYLTARFDIPSVFINSQAKQGGEDRDIYAEPIQFTNAPLTFERDGKVLHKLRPVESYVLDENGEPMYMDASEDLIQIRSSQRWQLQRDGGGFAEMSANLGDLASAPEGDVVIDPSATFEGEAYYGGGDIYDVYLDEGNPNYNYGSYHYLKLGNTNGNEKRILFGFTNVSSIIPDGSIILDAKLKLNVQVAPTNPGTILAAAYKNIAPWDMTSVTWNGTGSWDGGLYTSDYQSPSITLPSSLDSVTFDITKSFTSHYETEPNQHLGGRGFLLKVIDSTSDAWQFYSTENFYTAERPVLEVDYATYTPGSQENIKTRVWDWNVHVDGPLSGAFFNSRWHYYFTSNNTDKQQNYILAPHSGNGQAYGLGASKSDIDDYVLKDNGSGSVVYGAIDATTPTIFVASEAYHKQFDNLPSADLEKDWYSRMAAIFDVWKDSSGNVHGFFHAEDNHIGEVGGVASSIQGLPDKKKSYGIAIDESYDIAWIDGEYQVISYNGISHIEYSRIGYTKSTNGYNFLHVNGNAYDGSGNSSTNPGPLIECFLSEKDWLEQAASFSLMPTNWPPEPWEGHEDENWDWQKEWSPSTLGHGPGCRHPNVIEYNGDLYLFYDRVLLERHVDFYKSDGNGNTDIAIEYPNGDTLSDQGSYLTVHVAKASVSDVEDYDDSTSADGVNPWQKYFNNSFNEPAVGGYSSPIVQPVFSGDKNLQTPNVTYNEEIDKHIMLVSGLTKVSGNNVGRLYLYIEDTAALHPLTEWGAGMKLDEIYTDTGSGPMLSNRFSYGHLISKDTSNGIGNSDVSSDENYLYYTDIQASAVNRFKRFPLEISQ